MIPVRVPADARVHQVGGVKQLTPEHPLYFHFCPVCDRMLETDPITLVYVGVEADARKDTGWLTGAAVAVHAACTHRGTAEATT